MEQTILIAGTGTSKIVLLNLLPCYIGLSGLFYKKKAQEIVIEHGIQGHLRLSYN
ncbi:MAG TPA: hypothetical protein VKY37_12635 [Brumimicrobium sp.]|nr:hypothetical protein [Brumimicrobium sp.]